MPDSAGQVEIAATLVDGFLEMVFPIQHVSQIMRYTREARSPFGKEIELIVGNLHGLEILVQ